MITRRNTRFLPPMLALSMTLVMAASVHAQDRRDTRSNGTTATLRVDFGTTPRWMNISGTRVEEIPMAERPDYDMFRYGGSYYAYHNDRWYTSNRGSGDFIMIEDSSVPNEFVSIPREHWRSYPSRWQQNNDRRSSGSSATFQVTFGSRPRWTNIRGTGIRELRQRDRQDYDMFSYGGRYYVYANNNWYMSRRSSGQFFMIDDRSVPNELANIPRNHWRNYPSAWMDDNGNHRRGNRGQDRYRR